MFAVLWSRWRSDVFLMPHERKSPCGSFVLSVWEDFLPSCGSFVYPSSLRTSRRECLWKYHNCSLPIHLAKDGIAVLITTKRSQAPQSRTQREAKPIPWQRRMTVLPTIIQNGGTLCRTKTRTIHLMRTKPTSRNTVCPISLTWYWKTELLSMSAASAEDSRMGDVLDALTMEKIDRAVWIPAHCPVELFTFQCYNSIKISDRYTHCISGG